MTVVLSTIDPAQDMWGWRGCLVEDTTRLGGWTLELKLSVVDHVGDVMVGNLLQMGFESPDQEEGDEFSWMDDGAIHDFKGNLNN